MKSKSKKKVRAKLPTTMKAWLSGESVNGTMMLNFMGPCLEADGSGNLYRCQWPIEVRLLTRRGEPELAVSASARTARQKKSSTPKPKVRNGK